MCRSALHGLKHPRPELPREVVDRRRAGRNMANEHEAYALRKERLADRLRDALEQP